MVIFKTLTTFIFTLITTSAVLALYTSLPIEQVYFDHAKIFKGDWFRLISAHFVHVDNEHLVWNLLGLIVLGYIIEIRSKLLLLLSITIGILSVLLFLFSPWSMINIYCGLSGMLNTLLVVALWLVWNETKSPWIVTTFVVCFLKIILEIYLNQSLISNISWPPSPESHMAGFLGGIVMVTTLHFQKNTIWRGKRQITKTIN